jgi:NAD(P)-dependent dehydrogenase (short-subunit alcohol dehydrogenase family)
LSSRVLLTGGTGLLGEQLVSQLLEDNFEVITTTSKLAKARRKYDDTNLDIFHVNFLDENHVQRFERVLKSFDGFDFLINNARSLEFLESDNLGLCSSENLIAEYKINVAMPLRLVGVLMRLKKPLRGIINISSQYSSVVPNPIIYASPSEISPIQYNVSKAALDKLTKELAVRLSSYKTRVNGIAFGGIKGRASEDFITRYESLAPHSRMLDLSECYGTLRWLMSDDSMPLNGHIIEANAGWTLC